MSKEEIRHCPYCGAAAKVRHDDENTWVECKKGCGARSNSYPNYMEQAREYAIEDWNSLGEVENL